MDPSDTVIALPSGGGAIEGLGETFSPDLFTGTGNFTVPLALPPGRNGFQPELILGYSTGHGNGVFGSGWSLSVPGIARETARGVPRFQDPDDVFILSGAEKLVPVAGDFPGVVQYRPRTEGLFARIEYHRDATNSFWRVYSRDGLVSTYGTPGQRGNDTAVLADPADPTRIFNWQLSQTQDPFGNRIRYEYEQALDVQGRWGQIYLRRILYVDTGDSDGAPADDFLVSISLDYEDRPDPFSSFRAGFQVRTTRRCQRIAIHTHAGQSRLARRYQFIYVDQRVMPSDSHAASVTIGDATMATLPAAALPLNGMSQLSQMHISGHDETRPEPSRRQALPPLEFSYTRFDPIGRDLLPLQGRDLPAASLADPTLELVDLLGNGLPDFVEMNGVTRYWRNLGGGRFDMPRLMHEAPAGLSFADPGVQLIDANGNGRADLLVSKPNLNGYFPIRFGGYWDSRSFQRYAVAPSFDLAGADVALVDLDGDGVTDAIRSGQRLECYFNDPLTGWGETRRVARRPLVEFPDVDFADPRVRFADMTGDGLQDIVLLHDGNIEYWPNRGHGNWGARVRMRNSPRFPAQYQPRQILLGDVDGDGSADLIFVDHCKITLWINRSGNGWSEAIEIDGTPGFTNQDDVRLVDLLGTGVAGILWSQSLLGSRRDQHCFLDFTGGVKPYLLNRMDNHRGATTTVTHNASTAEYLRDQQQRESRWKTPLPFPVQVVSRVEVIDVFSRGRLCTEYSYHHGYWDGGEREYRGFGCVEQRSTETFDQYYAAAAAEAFDQVEPVHYAAPALTRSWFNLGPVGDEFGGWEAVDHRDEYWSGDAPYFDDERVALATFLGALDVRRDRRDALRALRGTLLRSEMYGADASTVADRPYTVTETAFGLREIAGADDEAITLRQRVFFPHPLAQRTTQWERGDEPMTTVSYKSDYDAYGQSRNQTSLAVPRGRDFRTAAGPSEPYLGTHTVTGFAQRDDDQRYMVDRTASITSHEIVNDGSQALHTLVEQVHDGTATLQVISQSLNYYDGDAFIGLPLGQLGDSGAPVRSETLVLTEAILQQAYRTGVAVLDPPEFPPYLDPNAAPEWTPEYPQEFRDLLPPLAGYHFHSGDVDHQRGYFAVTSRQRYDFHDNIVGVRGLLLTLRDSLGRDTTISYDAFDLLPVTVTGPNGLTTTARYDYRLAKPDLVTDPNGNQTAYAYTPLGMLASLAVMGKVDESVGDSPEQPGTRLEYDLLAYVERGQPVSARTSAREHHVHDTEVPQPERDATIVTVEYSDGFGRLLQTRAQAEDLFFGDAEFANNANLPADQSQPGGPAIGQQEGPDASRRVLVSGWQVYDNKGQVVEKYEPFFSASGFDFAAPLEQQLGRRVQMFYDPRGRVVRTLNPDGAQQRIVYGAPRNLDDPDSFLPTPWEIFSYDANDNAGRTHPATTQAYQDHWNTPGSTVLDALGRTVAAVERNGPDADQDWLVTRSNYDIRGNLLSLVDALGRTAFRHVYDLADNPLRTDSIDAGLQRRIIDVLGNVLEQRDGKGALVLAGFDELNRAVRVWARDGTGQTLSLRQQLIYGDSSASGLSTGEATTHNLLGQLMQHYDEAGRLTVSGYDFKGNLLESTRQVISDTAILSVFGAPPPGFQISAFRVDWQAVAGTTLNMLANTVLDPRPYTTTTAFDALNRASRVLYPANTAGRRRLLVPRYNRAGALQSVTLDDEIYVQHIAYNAKAQRTLIAYGNGVMTRHAYDPDSFRLLRLRSEHYTQPDEHSYEPTGTAQQDFAYAYDLAGNILSIHDRTPDSGIPNTPLGPQALGREFSYDPVYRLVAASGRECDTQPTFPPWDDTPRCHDPTLTRAYAQHYSYDAMGNMVALQHAAAGGSFTRAFTHIPGNNRLAVMRVGQTDFDYDHDASGNLLRETTSRHFEWDHSNRMRVFRTQPEGAEPSVHAHYLYDAAGQRIKKLVRRQGGQVDASVYIDGIFEHQWRVQGTTSLQNNTLHVMDGQQRLAQIRVGAAFPGDGTPAVEYQLGDHLGSSNVVLDVNGTTVAREEYTPYGETSFGETVHKYRYAGKEREEESGLQYFGARYYACHLCRWTAVDPSGTVDGINLYRYARNSPLGFVDGNGRNSIKTNSTKKEYFAARDKAVAVLYPNGDLGYRHFEDIDYGVHEAVDVSEAFDLLFDVLDDELALKITEYYARWGNVRHDQVAAYAETRITWGDAKTIINMDKIYEHMTEYQYGMPSVDVKDDKQRAVFIASNLFHEYLHVLQNSTLVNENYEGAAWAGHYWFLKQVGGHEFLEKFALNLFAYKGDYYESADYFNETLYILLDFSLGDVTYEQLNAIYTKGKNYKS